MTTLIDRFIDAVGRTVAWFAVFMAILTVVVVVLRYGFNTGSIFMQELVFYMHGAMFMLGLAYTMQHDAHVRVDIVYARFSPRRKALTNLCGHLIFLTPMSMVMFFGSLDYVVASWSILEASEEVGGIPALYLLKTVIPLAALLLMLQTCAEVLRFFRHSSESG